MRLGERVKNILINPMAEWAVIKKEDHSTSDLFIKYTMILALIPAISKLFKNVLFVQFSTGETWFFKNLSLAIFWYIILVVSVYGLSYILDILSPTFGSTKQLKVSLKIAVFTFTPFWFAASILELLPESIILWSIIGAYCYFILYTGLIVVKEIPKAKALVYSALAIGIYSVFLFIIYN